MNTRSIVIYVLIVLLSAPLVKAAPAQESPDVWRAYSQKLDAGAHVQIHLKSGKKVEGYYIPGSADTFRLKPKTRIAVPIRDFDFNDIELIERKKDGWSPGRKVLVGTGIGAGIGLFVLAAIFASYD